MVIENFSADIFVAAFIGLLGGGTGGLIVGSIWKHHRASIVGGIMFTPFVPLPIGLFLLMQ